MGLTVRTGAVALAAVIATTNAMAASQKCAKPEEVTAIQAAAIQQELMVAALTCNQVANFNAFQIGYGPELRTSDATLEKMFKRLFGGRPGEDAYHAFKTRMANDSSIRSIRDNSNYCQETSNAFASALVPAKPTLTAFVSSISVQEQSPVDSCEIRVAVSLPGAASPAASMSDGFILPKPKPMPDGAAPMPSASDSTPAAVPAPASTQ